jgi:hypothetical protein
MCLSHINIKKTKEYQALETVTVYKALKIVDGKILSIFRDQVWVPGVRMLSSRDTSSLTDLEEATGQVTLGFHFYLYRSPATPAPSWVCGQPWRQIQHRRALGEFQVRGHHIVAVGKFGRSWSAVATIATLIDYKVIR